MSHPNSSRRPAISDAKLPGAIASLVVILAILLGTTVLLGVFVATASLHPASRDSSIVNGQVTIPVNELVYYKLAVPSGYSNVTITGSFAVSAGSPINVYIMDEGNYRNFQSGLASYKVFDSGTTTSGLISGTVQSGTTYYLVYNNPTSTTTYVQTTAIMHLR